MGTVYNSVRQDGKGDLRLPVLLPDSADLLALCGHNAGGRWWGKGIAWGACLEERKGKEEGKAGRSVPFYEMGEGGD